MAEGRVVRVVIWAMRHGLKLKRPKLEDNFIPLSNEGRAQVKRSARNNFSGITFSGVYSSPKLRAVQTASIASGWPLLDSNAVSARFCRPGLDYAGAPRIDDDNYYNACAKEVARLAKKQEIPETIAHWAILAPTMIKFLRRRFSQELLSIATTEALRTPNDSGHNTKINILVASHSPVIESAAEMPTSTPMLMEADIIKYFVRCDITKTEDLGLVSTGGIKTEAWIEESQYISREF